LREKDFTHFSVYEVWDNIPENLVLELEGLFLQVYAKDAHANILNRTRNYAPLALLKRRSKEQWVKSIARDGR
jgi:hypothetical protein